MAPEMICFSSRCKNDKVICQIIKRVREFYPLLPIICGGFGPTYTPLQYLEGGATLVVRGEGEIAMEQILERHGTGRDFHDVTNACYLKEGELVCNQLAPPLRTFTDVPRPLVGEQHVTFIENNTLAARDPAYDDATFPILLGRGCVGDCSYCAAPVLRNLYKENGSYMPRYRKGNLESALLELEMAKKHGVTSVQFKDEYLTLSPKELIAFFALYKERIGLLYKANFHHQHLLFHADVRQAVIQAGFHSYAIGFQAGEEAMAREVYNRPHLFKDFLELAQILFHEFVTLQYHFVSGTTLNTDEEFQEKLQLIKSLPFDPVLPQRTLLFDFQFYPQEGARMTTAIGKGKIERVATLEWGLKALLCQLRVVANDSDFASLLASARPELPCIEELQKTFLHLQAQKKKEQYARLNETFASTRCLCIKNADENHSARSPVADIPILATIPMFQTAKDRTRFMETLKETGCTENTPILLASTPLLESARLLRRECGLTNPIYPVESFPTR